MPAPILPSFPRVLPATILTALQTDLLATILTSFSTVYLQYGAKFRLIQTTFTQLSGNTVEITGSILTLFFMFLHDFCLEK
jgi:hypothetical protein